MLALINQIDVFSIVLFLSLSLKLGLKYLASNHSGCLINFPTNIPNSDTMEKVWRKANVAFPLHV